MPRGIGSALQSILPLDFLQSYHTLEASFPNGEVLRLAGAEVEISGQAPFRRGVIRSNGLRQSLGTAIDVVDISADNIDWSHSRRLLASSPDTLVTATVGRIHRDYRNNGEWIWRSLLRGVVGVVIANEAEATYKVISDLAAAGKVGAIRLVSRSCQWKYKGPECSYSGSLPTCDFTFTGPNGCSAHGVQHRYGGYIYDVDKLSLILPAPDDGGGGGGGGGGFDPSGPDGKLPIAYSY